jgi:hypothetical protein
VCALVTGPPAPSWPAVIQGCNQLGLPSFRAAASSALAPSFPGGNAQDAATLDEGRTAFQERIHVAATSYAGASHKSKPISPGASNAAHHEDQPGTRLRTCGFCMQSTHQPRTYSRKASCYQRTGCSWHSFTSFVLTGCAWSTPRLGNTQAHPTPHIRPKAQEHPMPGP